MDVSEPSIDASLPDIRLRSKWYQAGFILLCCSAQLLAQAQLGMVLVPLEEIGRSLGTSDPGELSWMVASYGQAITRCFGQQAADVCSLTVGMFLIPGGRLGDIW
jgi:hypothetical protein